MTTTAEVRPIRPNLPTVARLTPFIAKVHCTAAFITAHDLPVGTIAFLGEGVVLVDLAGLPHPEGDLVRWASYLDKSERTNTPLVRDGRLHEDHSVTGFTPDGTFVQVIARRLITEARS